MRQNKDLPLKRYVFKKISVACSYRATNDFYWFDDASSQHRGNHLQIVQNKLELLFEA